MALDLLDQFSNSLNSKRVGIVEFAESEDFCNPPEAPIWMADLSFKPIGEIQVGDKIVGWNKKENSLHKTLTETEVLHVQKRQSIIVKVTMESGRSFRCTPDHLWLSSSFAKTKNGRTEWFRKPEVGIKLSHIVDPTLKLNKVQKQQAAWLGGIWDGEGNIHRTGICITQCPNHNPEVFQHIKNVLNNLGINYHIKDDTFLFRTTNINGQSRTKGSEHRANQMFTNFVNWCNPIKKQKIINAIFNKRMSRVADKIVSVEPDGYGEVIALTTSTGNYIANGYASKNCSKPLYPRQRVLLKLIFLEEMTGEEEDVLTEWINNPRGEVQISPNIRERRQKLRDLGYPHFREIILVGGRRSSKGHMTGLSYAYKIWQQIALGDPHSFYGIDRDKQIYFTIMATSEDQAKKHQFADVRGALRSCKAMEPYLLTPFKATEINIHTPHDIKRMNTSRLAHGNTAYFSSLLVMAAAANASSVRGQACMTLDLDEMAHMMEGVNTKSSAEEIFDAATPSLDQFGKHALIFENSSPYTKIGKFYENYCQGMNILEDGTISKTDVDYRQLVFQFPSWELYRDWFSHRKRLRLENANPIARPPEESEPMRIEEKKNPEKFKVERRAHFAEVLEGFLLPEMVDRCFDPYDGRYLKSHGSRMGYGPETAFKIHGDPATTDKNFGFVVAHVEYKEDELDRIQPHCIIDLVHAWVPAEQPNHTINFLDIQEEILEHVLNFRAEDVTFDQFQSNNLLHFLRREAGRHKASGMNIREIVASPKVNLNRAEIAKTAINLGLVHIPHDNRFCELLKNELKFLQRKGDRIIHQTTGPIQTKDIADCLFECINYLLGDYIRHDLNSSLTIGAHGGYTYQESIRSFESQWYGQNRQTSSNFINRARSSRPIRGSDRRRYF